MTTYGKGENHIFIAKRDASVMIQKFGKEHQSDLTRLKDNDKLQKGIDNIFKAFGTTYDIPSFEKFFDENYLKGAGNIDYVYGVSTSDASNIKMNGKSITNEDFHKYVNSFGVGPEYIASVGIQQDGIVRSENDVQTNNDLVSASPLARIAHIHIHQDIITKKITYDYVIKEGPYKGEIFHHDLDIPVRDIGPDAADRSTAGYSVWSVVINKRKIWLYSGGTYGDARTITFDRKTRK